MSVVFFFTICLRKFKTLPSYSAARLLLEEQEDELFSPSNNNNKKKVHTDFETEFETLVTQQQ